jgi:hypothetical protein
MLLEKTGLTFKQDNDEAVPFRYVVNIPRGRGLLISVLDNDVTSFT